MLWWREEKREGKKKEQCVFENLIVIVITLTITIISFVSE
jgi:hypothetical protein